MPFGRRFVRRRTLKVDQMCNDIRTYRPTWSGAGARATIGLGGAKWKSRDIPGGFVEGFCLWGDSSWGVYWHPIYCLCCDLRPNLLALVERIGVGWYYHQLLLDYAPHSAARSELAALARTLITTPQPAHLTNLSTLSISLWFCLPVS